MFKDKNKDRDKDRQEDKAKDKETGEAMLEAELKVLRDELAKKDDCHDRLLRLQAEFDNFRKRSIRERQEFIKYANEGLILELVGMLDNFQRSIKSADLKQDFKLLHSGVDMISRQLHKLLEEKGLKKIDSIGQRFDPNKHEAIEAVVSDKAQEGCILEEFQPGYILNDRVIRPAMVKVAKTLETVEEEVKDKKEEEKRRQGSEDEDREEVPEGPDQAPVSKKSVNNKAPGSDVTGVTDKEIKEGEEDKQEEDGNLKEESEDPPTG
jgi:molecular chaperone GrpE